MQKRERFPAGLIKRLAKLHPRLRLCASSYLSEERKEREEKYMYIRR